MRQAILVLVVLVGCSGEVKGLLVPDAGGAPRRGPRTDLDAVSTSSADVGVAGEIRAGDASLIDERAWFDGGRELVGEVGGADAGPDVVEASFERAREVGGPEAGPEARPEAGPEARPDVGPDLLPDLAPACPAWCSGGCYVGCAADGQCRSCATCTCDVASGTCHC